MFWRKKKQLTREQSIKKHLKGDLQKNALDFAPYMNDSFACTHLGENFCFMCVDPGHLYIYFGNIPGSLCFRTDESNSDNKSYPMDESVKEFVWANVNQCNHFRTNGKICGCGQQPGHSFTILGKKFDNLCNCPICFKNPDAETFEKIKELVEAWKRCIKDKHGN